MTRCARGWRGSILLALALLSALGAAWLGPTPSAHADGLISFDIETGGRAVQVFDDDGTGARTAEVDVPESTAVLRAGPVGQAFSSIVWPGATAGNLGSLVRVLQPSLPPSVTALNDPIRAQASTGQNPPTSTLSLPDVTMTATASDQLVEGRAAVGTVTGESGPTSGFTSFASASLRNGNPAGTASASVSGVSIANGLLAIAAVTSTASATSDGAKGAGTASTVVAGLSVAGVAVHVDDQGLHLGSAGAPLNSLVDQVLNRLLASAGIQVALGVPTRMVNGASATMLAPALVVTVKSSSGVLGLVLGGAQVSVSGVPETPAPVPVVSRPAAVAAPQVLNVVPSGSTSPGPASFAPGPSPTTAVSGGARPVALGPITPIDGHRLRGGAVAFALLAAALLAAGLGQLFLATIGRHDDGCVDGTAPS